MKFQVKHEMKGRLRIHVLQNRMSHEQADTLQYYLINQKLVTSAKVYDRTGDVAICYLGERKDILKLLQEFQYEKVTVPEVYINNSGRKLNDEYWEKLVNSVVFYYGKKLFLPAAARAVITVIKSTKYIYKGVRTLLAGTSQSPRC